MWISSIARDVELHKSIDEITIGVRSKTEDIIVCEMKDSVNEVLGIEKSTMKDRDEILNLFYRFVNDFEETRNLAFTYWEDYYVRLYAISLYLLGLLYTLFFNAYELIVSIYYPLYACGPIAFAGILFLLCSNLNDRLVERIYRLSRQHIGNIKNTYRDEFRQEVKARFT
jgi:hypothetical protein